MWFKKKKWKFSRFPSFRFCPILPKIENSEISEICLFLQILAVVINQDFRDLRVFDFALHPRSKAWKSWKFCLPRILTLVITQGLKTPKKWTEAKTKMFRYDLEQNQKFPRFPSFRFCPTPKIENLEILEILFTSNIDTVCNSRFKNAKEMNWDKN